MPSSFTLFAQLQRGTPPLLLTSCFWVKMSAALQAPVRVSPLIRFGRWSLLTAGVFYGLYNNSRLSKKEALWREHEAKEKVIRDAKKAVEKKRLVKEEMQYLSQATGMPLPDEFK